MHITFMPDNLRVFFGEGNLSRVMIYALVPTLENLGDYFKDLVKEKMNAMNWELLQMEISETPSRSYII